MHISVCVCVCEFRMQVLKSFFIGLTHKTQQWEANLRVGRSWVPNTFPRAYKLRTHTLVVRSKVLSREDAIYMVSRPTQKLGDDSKNDPLCPQLPWMRWYDWCMLGLIWVAMIDVCLCFGIIDVMVIARYMLVCIWV